MRTRDWEGGERGRARRPLAAASDRTRSCSTFVSPYEWSRTAAGDQVHGSGPTRHHHDGPGHARRNRRGSSSRSHRDHREARGLEELQRRACVRPESRSSSGRDVEPVTARFPGHEVNRLTYHVICAVVSVEEYNLSESSPMETFTVKAT